MMKNMSVLSDLPAPSSDTPANTLHHPASLKSLAADFEKLERAVDGADADPSPDAQASYGALSKMLDATLAN
ncbi:MAG TPA: hypothetical protein VN685_07930 [Rhizomicrobium sp.]|nr:hypothetical protein [Rhizomicrobium sp.]